MRTIRRLLTLALAVAAIVVAGRAALRRHPRLQGCWYRLRGRRPDPDVGDLVLADRVRSTLGPLEARLDVPRVHVTVHDRIATLHGEVRWPHQAATIERAVAEVSGIAGVDSHLAIGLSKGVEPRSAASRRPKPPSAARKRLRAAAAAAGAPEDDADRQALAALAAFLERIPAGERAQVTLHLPKDVRSALALTRHPRAAAAARDLDDVAAAAGVAPEVVEAIVHELAELVPEEVADVRAVLPPGLRTVLA